MQGVKQLLRSGLNLGLQVELRGASRSAPLFAVVEKAGVFRHWGRFETYR